MLDEKKLILTNNPKVAEVWGQSKTEYKLVTLESVREVLLKARDLIHKNYQLVNHTMTANIPIYKHPYRTLALVATDSLHQDSLMLIESSLEKLAVGKLPPYPAHVLKDFQDLDLTIFQEVKL